MSQIRVQTMEYQPKSCTKDHIPTHGKEAYIGMRKAGKLAAECLDMLIPEIKAGITTHKIDQLAYEFILDHKAIPACLGYRGYQHTVCTSVNHVICHGIPGKKVLKEGDIVNIDVTVIIDGWHGDTSRMYAISPIKRKADHLMKTTYQSLMHAIKITRPGTTLGDIGASIQELAESNRLSVVRDFSGHGIGRKFHESPTVFHYGKKGEGIQLQEGMFFTIEPMLNTGGYDCKILSDGWTTVTKDKSLSAQFEHTIGVTENGAEIFTLSPKGFDFPEYT